MAMAMWMDVDEGVGVDVVQRGSAYEYRRRRYLLESRATGWPAGVVDAAAEAEPFSDACSMMASGPWRKPQAE